jgi:exosortase C (VPDSG-CTERM-specific)
MNAACLAPAKIFGGVRGFVWMSVVLVLAFSVPLYELVRFAAGSTLYSYILLIPFISAYLIRLEWSKLPMCSGPARFPAVGFFLAGLALLVGYMLARRVGGPLEMENFLAFMMTAFVLFFVSVCCWSFGKDLVQTLAFPIGFLVFLVPMPILLTDGIEAFLQQGSAAVAEGFLQVAGASFIRDGLTFRLPTITLFIAPECSGIHSSLVLLITSLVAGQLFLRSPWKRTVFAMAVLPLALLRNGFRVFVIGELCTHIGPEMIDSPIHHKGGPLFFALSLIPFFLFLFFLRKTERFNKNSKSP